MSLERVVVTGATGHVGRYVVHALAARGLELVALSRSGELPEPPFGEQSAKNVRGLSLDLEQESAVVSLSELLGANTALVHLAAWHPPATATTSPGDRRRLMSANVFGTMRALEAARQRPTSVVVYASTFEVYGLPEQSGPLSEDARLSPISDYGATKLAGEDHLLAFAYEERTRVVALRMPAIYGPGETTSRALPNFLRQVSRGERPRVLGTGADLRDQLHARDAALAVELALLADTGGIFNIADGVAHSIHELAASAMQVAGMSGEPESAPSQRASYDFHMDIGKARRELGFEPRVALAAGMAEELGWLRSPGAAVSFELPPPSYDESAVADYVLPALLRAEDGSFIADARDFAQRRRPELLELFRRHVFGRLEAQLEVRARRVRPPEPCCGGLGLQSELDVELTAASSGRQLSVRVLLHAPSAATRPSPAFLGLNLFGNHSLHADPRITLAAGWLPENAELGLTGNRATEASRGVHAGRWPVEAVLARGYALVTAYAGDIDPDFDDGFDNGLHALLAPSSGPRPADAPGTIAAWAFGLSRLLDALESVPEIDAKRVAVIGHSRLAKTALWAAAQDERFAVCISNQSGCGGAALSRRRYGERLLHINRRFPHWFCGAFQAYDEREHELPLDQHQLLALLAPRPLYVASAEQDRWADPRGEWLACQAALPAWALFGHDAPLVHATAPSDSSADSRIGYHLRPGRHDITPRDFWHYLAFVDRWL